MRPYTPPRRVVHLSPRHATEEGHAETLVALLAALVALCLVLVGAYALVTAVLLHGGAL